MERPRCAGCRNPIRNAHAVRHGGAEDSWYHQDCWEEFRTSEQERYAEDVRAGGLAALLAPYGHG